MSDIRKCIGINLVLVWETLLIHKILLSYLIYFNFYSTFGATVWCGSFPD